MNPRKAGCMLAAFLIASLPLALAQGTYTQFDPPGSLYTAAGGIDTAGDIVGYYVDASSNWHGFLFSGGTYTNIDYPGAAYTYPNGINDLGQIVGHSSLGNGFLYDEQTQTFTTIIHPFASQTYAFGINNAGTIVGAYFHVAQHGWNSKWIGFELVGSKFYDVFPPNVEETYVLGVSASDKAVGYSTFASSLSNFFYYRGRYKDLPLPFEAGVNGINPAGTTVVGAYSPSQNVTAGFVNTSRSFQELQFPGSTNTFASGINASGVVVGYFRDSSNVTHGFTWTPPGDAAKK
jgi:probable HAF family extracellular repeat protein